MGFSVILGSYFMISHVINNLKSTVKSYRFIKIKCIMFNLFIPIIDKVLFFF